MGEAALTHTSKYDRLTRDDLDIMRAMHKAGKPQTEIAQALGCSQGTVSKWLSALFDSTDVAKEYLRGSALRMAKNVVQKGQARDHIKALEGLGVLQAEQRDIKIAIGVSLPGLSIQSHSATDPGALSPGRQDDNA